MFWHTDTGSMLVIRVSLGFASDGSACSGTARDRFRRRVDLVTQADRMRSGTCRTTFLEGG
jgi:hypothetical protein